MVDNARSSLIAATPPIMETDPELEAVKRKLALALARQQAQTGEDTAGVQADVGTRQRNLQQQHPIELKNMLENFAGRGMAYSGRYATDVGDNENQYAGALSSLDTEKANRITAIQRALANFQDDQQSTLDDAQGAFAQRQAAQAEKQAAAAGAITAQAATDNAAALQGVENPTILQSNPVPSIAQTYPDTSIGRENVVTGAGTFGVGGKGMFFNTANPMNETPAAAVSLDAPAAVSPTSTAPVAKMAAPAPTTPLTGQAALGIGSVRALNTWSPTSQTQLKGGATVVAGNGYSYKMINGVPTRVG